MEVFMKEIKKIRLTDSPTSKEVKKFRLESISKQEDQLDIENRMKYDVYENNLDSLYNSKKEEV